MSIFNFIGGQVALSSSAVQSTDNFANGVRFNTSGSALASTSAPTTLSNGLPFASTGVVSYVDATAGLPAGTTWTNGLPFSSSGALCVSTTAPTVWSNGVPFDLNGAVSALVNSLELNFLQGSLDSRITFARADATTCATFFNDSGLLQTAAANVPRFDFDPVTRTPRGLLIEESRQNLLLQSRDMTQAAWNKTASTVTRDQVGIDGVANSASKIVETAVTNTFSVQSAAAGTVSASTACTVSVVAKASGRNFATLQINDGTNTNAAWCCFNLTTGAVTTAPTMLLGTFTGMSASSVNLGGGWWRLIFTVTLNTVPNATPYIGISNDGVTRSYAGTAGQGIIVDCAQLEVGAFATSIIPTTTTALTRAADSASMTGTNFSSWFNASAGTFVVEVANSLPNLATSPARAFSAMQTGTAEQIAIGVDVSRVRSGAVDIGSFYSSTVFTGKRAIAYAANEQAAANSGAVVSSTNAGLPSGLTTLWIGQNNSLSACLNGHIRSLRYYPVRLGNSTLQALTA